MNLEYLNILLGFHYWARDRVLSAAAALTPGQYARPMGNSFSSVHDTLNHVYLAEWIWHERWNGVSPTAFPSIDMPDVDSLRRNWTALESKVRAHVTNAGQAGLERVIAYSLMSGKAGESTLWQMVTHVVNHATYHRGQVTTLLRQLGAAPAEGTDLITYYRLHA
jgi:uncharacterized damage-inducible protein DinB